MLRVLFDLASTQGYGSTKYHGGGEYAKLVFRECVANLPPDVAFEAHLETRRFTDPAILELAAESSITLHYVDSPRALEDLLRSGCYDRYYSALPVERNWDFDIPPSTQFIFTLHGLRGLLVQDWHLRINYGPTVFHGLGMAIILFFFGKFRHRQHMKTAERKIDATANRVIIGVSHYAKFGYMAAIPGLDLSEMRILDSVTERMSPERDSSILTRAMLAQRKFFLVVSANRYEKNAFRALRALDLFFSSVKDHPALSEYRAAVTGLSKDSRLVHRLRLKNPTKFVFLNYLARGELEELYATANALVYPSLSEGYGYPPVQAMRYNTPSICAGGTSIPEICGEAAIYFDPYDVEEIVARLWEVCDAEARANLVPKLAPRETLLRERQEHALDEICRLIVGNEGGD